MSSYELFCGDCLDVMRDMEDASIDLTVTSPPYDNLRTYNGYTFDFEGIASELYRVTKPGGVVVWVVGDATINGSETGTSFRQALYFMECGFNLHDTMIYQTDKPPMNGNRYQACFEYMFVFSKDRPNVFNAITERCKYAGVKHTKKVYFQGNGALAPLHGNGVTKETKVRASIWKYVSGIDKSGHPAAFPEALARDHILSWSNPGDMVFDPFLGSGTTGKMAMLLDRQFIGIEISREYIDEIAEPRIADAARIARKEFKPLGGETNFDELPLFSGTNSYS